ncbi:hypothetical protein FHS51_001736 [Sphingobium wenxiniae]|uniref:Uncharacterized protein n=1 Tax=Sphingobium wenxiniae (strain DSM 21828 / CGMCC 1.7748 / JZ-1) TaxID=595605 RepID=A0A562KCS1_SPHWJ|nr:hypothetical protein [Sphingobium wenxiniae]MBB6191509.1 hypothetical protein [Sphingobium wenxiniae]TWH93201.1 hypothetical protein IQ35_02108 [Sphingobium wenxiniae]
MERRVNFHDRMDLSHADLNNVQAFAQSSMDDIVADGLTADRKYAGFDAVATGVAELTVQPGRLYVQGRVYKRDTVFTKDFTTSLPIATRKIVSLVIYGDEAQTDVRPREFLLDVETGSSESRTVAMETARLCTINVASGQENADPLPPILDAGVVEVARIVLIPTGIQSVTMMTANRLDSVQAVAARTGALETFRDRVDPQVASLASDIAALTKGQATVVGLDMYGRMLGRIAVMEKKLDIPGNALDSAADFFLDASGSDLAFAGSSVKLQEGLRFADDAANVAPLQVFDPLNPKAKIVGGMLFPAYSRARRMSVGPATGEVQLSAYTYATHEMVQKTVSRTRIRYGGSWTVSTSAAWWKSGLYNATASIFGLIGEALVPTAFSRAVLYHHHVRVPYFWEDSYEETYWEDVTTAHSVNGTQVAETFLQANDMWLDAVGLRFTRLAADGAVTIAICETDRGAPLLDKVIARATVERAALKLGEDTVIPLQPTFLTGGVRYAIVILTAADHWVGTVQGSVYPQGTMFYVLDGAYQQGDGTKDIAFSLHAAEFAASRTVIELAPIQLIGGVVDIDVLAPTVVPGAAQLTYEVQIGSIWHPLASAQELALGAGGAIPPLLPFRAVFSGTTDVMPAVSLTGSQVAVSRPRTAFTHFSAIRNLPSSSDSIHVTARLEDFDGDHHVATCHLRTGGGYATETAPSTTVDNVTEDGAIERTWTFALGAPVASYRIKLSGTTDNVLNGFHIAARKDFAL